MGKKSAALQPHPIMKLLVIPRPLKKSLLCQVIVAVAVVWLWIHFNGGLLPSFLHRDPADFTTDPLTNVLLYFPDANNDGSRIRWARAVNSPAALDKVLKGDAYFVEGDVVQLQGQGITNQQLLPVMSVSPKIVTSLHNVCARRDAHFVEGDVVLQGQGTTNQQLLPVMSKSPKIESDLTFNVWADRVLSTNKAIKIDFHSVDAVEIVLNALKTRLKGAERPIWLHADVLRGPHSTTAEIDGKLFIRGVTRYFPTATISLGWTTGSHTDLTQSGYTWAAVMDMYDFIESHDILNKQPLTINVRLSLVENSVLQLKWLCDNTGASLTVFHSEDDTPTKKNMMYASFKFAPHKIFFDLNHSDLEVYLKSYRHFSSKRVNPLVHERETMAFRPKAWLKVGFHKHIKAVMPSEDAAILLTPDVHLLTKSKFEPSEKIRLYGRIMFLNRNTVKAEDTSGLQIYIRAAQIANPDDLVGIRVFIGVKGDVSVETVGFGETTKVNKRTKLTPSSTYCYRFAIVNAEKQISVRVTAITNCETLTNFREVNALGAELKVPIPRSFPVDARPMAVKVADRTRATVIDQLIIEYAADGVFSHPI